MIKTLKTAVPAHLEAEGREFFEQVLSHYQLVDPAGIALLVRAAECLDRMRRAQALIAEHGELVTDRYGSLKANPACNVERDSRTGFLSAVRALNLDIEPPRDRPGRPPLAAWGG